MSLRTRAGRWGAVADWIITALQGDTSTLAVYTLLAVRYADRDGANCYPSQKRIAADLGLSERTVQRSVARLKELGVLYAEKRTASGKGAVGNAYVLDDTQPAMGGGSLPATGGGSASALVAGRPSDTSYQIQRSENQSGAPDGAPPAPGDQSSLFEGEYRETETETVRLIKERYSLTPKPQHRKSLRLLIKQGLRIDHIEEAIEETDAREPRDPIPYLIAVARGRLEAGDDGGTPEAGRGGSSAARGRGAGTWPGTGRGNGRGHGRSGGAAPYVPERAPDTYSEEQIARALGETP